MEFKIRHLFDGGTSGPARKTSSPDEITSCMDSAYKFCSRVSNLRTAYVYPIRSLRLPEDDSDQPNYRAFAKISGLRHPIAGVPLPLGKGVLQSPKAKHVKATSAFEIPGIIGALKEPSASESTNAVGDSCAKTNFMEKSFARRIDLTIQQESISEVLIGNGKTVLTSGSAEALFRFKSDPKVYLLTFPPSILLDSRYHPRKTLSASHANALVDKQSRSARRSEICRQRPPSAPLPGRFCTQVYRSSQQPRSRSVCRLGGKSPDYGRGLRALY